MFMQVPCVHEYNNHLHVDYIHMHALCKCTYIHTYIHTYYVCMYVCMYVCTLYVCMYVCMYACIMQHPKRVHYF